MKIERASGDNLRYILCGFLHILIAMLKSEKRKFYRVRRGQSLREIAAFFGVSPRLLAKVNGLTTEPFEGQILVIPQACGNAYTVQEGDTKTLLCGGDEKYREKNGTDVFYIGMRVIL